ncbi:MAG: type II secretion system F family protein [Anaerolineae bacterium]
MTNELWFGPYSPLWSPGVFGVLLGLAVFLSWLAYAPARRTAEVEDRLTSYLSRGVALEEEELREPVVQRIIIPLFRQLLRLAGGLAPRRNLEATQKLLTQAGDPGQLSALDFVGLRVLALAIFAGFGFLLSIGGQGVMTALRNALLAGIVGFVLPTYWLTSKARQRRTAIARALPDALDMLTIGVEAGLAFESAMMRVGEKWHNPLTEEFRRAVGEMRVGASREEALQRMAERCDVPDLNTFVAILIQSSQLGVSISQVLHNQAAEMRLKRRQRAEERARQAGIKIMIPMAFFIFPALFVVILGPAIPTLLSAFKNVMR